jgi:hypothetical protein
MKRIPALLLLIVVINCYLFLPALAADKVIQNWPTSVDEMISTAKKSINMINMKEFDAVLESDAYDLIIDVREPYEFDRGHVPGAINIPRGVIEFMIWKKVGFPDKTDLGGKFTYTAGLEAVPHWQPLPSKTWVSLIFMGLI